MSSNVATGNGGGIYVQDSTGGSNGVVVLQGLTFSGNTATTSSTSADIYNSACASSVTIYSECAQNYYLAGSSLSYSCDSYPANLAATCSSCPSGQYSCCGAFTCSSTIPSCTSTYCIDVATPTIAPSPSPPSLVPTHAPIADGGGSSRSGDGGHDNWSPSTLVGVAVGVTLTAVLVLFLAIFLFHKFCRKWQLSSADIPNYKPEEERRENGKNEKTTKNRRVLL